MPIQLLVWLEESPRGYPGLCPSYLTIKYLLNNANFTVICQSVNVVYHSTDDESHSTTTHHQTTTIIFSGAPDGVSGEVESAEIDQVFSGFGEFGERQFVSGEIEVGECRRMPVEQMLGQIRDQIV